jgi:hypothetical protein
MAAHEKGEKEELEKAVGRLRGEELAVDISNAANESMAALAK